MKNLFSKEYGLGNRKVYWILCALVYLGLIYSTSLQNGFGPEKGITLNYFTSPTAKPPNIRDTRWHEYYPDQGVLNGTEYESVGSDFWKLSGFFGDAGFYVMQAESNGLSVPPFKYRFLPTSIIGWISRSVGSSIPDTFTIFNLILIETTALLFTLFLRRYFDFSNTLALIGGILFVSMAPTTRTLPFPSLEPISFLISMLLFLFAISQNRIPFILCSLIGVASKEIFILSGFIWLAAEYSFHKSIHLTTIVMIITPIIGFILIRYIIGGNLVEINFGYNVLKGEFPVEYVSRMLHKGTLIDLITRIFFSFSFLWLGVINFKKDRFLYTCSFIIPMVIMAAILLSGQITRVIGILFPIVITMFLLFFKKEEVRGE